MNFKFFIWRRKSLSMEQIGSWNPQIFMWTDHLIIHMAGATFNESFSTKILKLAHWSPTNEFVGWPSIIENSWGLGLCEVLRYST